MTFKQFGPDYLLRFDKDELLVEKLLQFVKSHSIHPSWVNGLGGAQWAEICFYELSQKQYSFKKIDRGLEVANITGNITWLNNQPAAHLHVVVADSNLQTFAGHLKELAVAATCELRLKTFSEAVGRKLDDVTGLDLLDI